MTEIPKCRASSGGRVSASPGSANSCTLCKTRWEFLHPLQRRTGSNSVQPTVLPGSLGRTFEDPGRPGRRSRTLGTPAFEWVRGHGGPGRGGSFGTERGERCRKERGAGTTRGHLVRAVWTGHAPDTEQCQSFCAQFHVFVVYCVCLTPVPELSSSASPADFPDFPCFILADFPDFPDFPRATLADFPDFPTRPRATFR